MNAYVRNAILTALLSLALRAQVFAQGTAFTYQGRLNASGVPATGTYDLRFTVYDSAGGATVVAGPLTGSGVPVTNGLFTVSLDFGTGVFTGPARWLQIAVRTNGAATFTNLSPRQALTATPYAIHAGTASNVVNGAVVKSLNNLRDNVTLAAGANVTLTPSGNTLTITSTGSNGLWLLNGGSAYYNGGNVGIGSSAPNHRLRVSGGPTWTGSGWLGSVELDNAAAIAWQGNAAGNHFGIGQSGGGLYFFSSASDPGNAFSPANYHMTIADNGNVGIGTLSPQSKLHLYEPADSASHVIETGGGVNAWARLSLKNLNGQWDIGTSRTFNGDQLYFSRLGAGIALGLQPNGDAFLARNVSVGGNVGIGTTTPADKLYIAGEGASGYAIGIEGNARQNRDKGGWVKAMAKVNADGSIAQQYSALGGTITASYDVAYLVTFPFQINDRFVSVTPFYNGSLGAVVATVFLNCPSCGPNRAGVRIYDAENADTLVANEFFIFVY